MAYWNNGQALNPTEIANAQQWAQGRSFGDIRAQMQSMGGTADQFGQIFGGTGAQATNYGYGSSQSSPYDSYQFGGGTNWTVPQAASPVTGTGAPPMMPVAPPIAQTPVAPPITQTPIAPGPSASYQGPTSVGSSWQQQNPYLDSMAAGITNQYNKNLAENVLPGVRYGAQAAGGFGGSRQGIAEGQAISGASEGLASALANLYGSSYEQSLNRDLQKYGIDVNSATSRYGTDKNYEVGMRNADNQLLGIQNTYDLGLRGDATDRQGLANQYDLGLRGDDTNRIGIANQYDIGLRNSANQSRGIDNAYTLGLMGDATNRYGIDTNSSTQRYGVDTNNATQRYGIDTNNATQRYGIDTNAASNKYASDNSLQGQLAGAGATMSVGQMNAGSRANDLAWDQFKYQDQAGMRELSWLADLYRGFSGLNGTDTTTGQNSPFAQFLGGSLTASQLLKMYQGG